AGDIVVLGPPPPGRAVDPPPADESPSLITESRTSHDWLAALGTKPGGLWNAVAALLAKHFSMTPPGVLHPRRSVDRCVPPATSEPSSVLFQACALPTS